MFFFNRTFSLANSVMFKSSCNQSTQVHFYIFLDAVTSAVNISQAGNDHLSFWLRYLLPSGGGEGVLLFLSN